MTEVLLSATPRSATIKGQTVLQESSSRSPWLCVRAPVGREDHAQQNIEALGYDTYLPKYEKVISHARRRRVVQRAFFPSYFFAAAGHTLGAAAAINRTHGVLSVVGGLSGEARVPEHLIRELRARETNLGLIGISADRFQPGQKVHVVAGACAGVAAVFLEANDERRAMILIDLLGKSHRVRVCPSALDVVI